MAEIHVGDVGTSFRAVIKDENDEIVDVSGATTKTITFKKPDGTLLVKDAELYTDGTDGIIEYISEENDLDDCGNWRLQGRVVFASGHWKSSIHDFKVEANLDS